MFVSKETASLTRASCVLILALLAQWGCTSTSAQLRAIEDGSFDPTLSMRLIPDRSSACLGDVVTVTHELKNESEYPVWVCRLGTYRLRAGQHGWSVVSFHLVCSDLAVLDSGDVLRWQRELELLSCSDCRCDVPETEIPEGLRDMLAKLPPCVGSLPLSAENAFHLAPPGRKWPERWVPQTLEVSDPAIEVSECESTSSSVGESTGSELNVHAMEGPKHTFIYLARRILH